MSAELYGNLLARYLNEHKFYPSTAIHPDGAFLSTSPMPFYSLSFQKIPVYIKVYEDGKGEASIKGYNVWAQSDKLIFDCHDPEFPDNVLRFVQSRRTT